MTERDEEDRADALFHALADRTRRDIMRRVLAGEHSVSALAAKYDMSFAAVQKHVAVLQKAGRSPSGATAASSWPAAT